jgi:hypothetical protein
MWKSAILELRRDCLEEEEPNAEDAEDADGPACAGSRTGRRARVGIARLRSLATTFARDWPSSICAPHPGLFVPIRGFVSARGLHCCLGIWLPRRSNHQMKHVVDWECSQVVQTKRCTGRGDGRHSTSERRQQSFCWSSCIEMRDDPGIRSPSRRPVWFPASLHVVEGQPAPRRA